MIAVVVGVLVAVLVVALVGALTYALDALVDLDVRVGALEQDHEARADEIAQLRGSWRR